MPVNMNIIENGRIIHYEYIDPWTFDDLLPLYAQVEKHLDRVAYKVHLLVDVRQMKNAPSNILKARREDAWLTHPNGGYVAVIGARGFESHC